MFSAVAGAASALLLYLLDDLLLYLLDLLYLLEDLLL